MLASLCGLGESIVGVVENLVSVQKMESVRQRDDGSSYLLSGQSSRVAGGNFEIFTKRTACLTEMIISIL